MLLKQLSKLEYTTGLNFSYGHCRVSFDVSLAFSVIYQTTSAVPEVFNVLCLLC